MSEIIKHDDLEGQLKVKSGSDFSTSHFVPSRGVIPRDALRARDEAAQMISGVRAQNGWY